MINIECDTKQLEETATKILDNIADYELLINKYFQKLGNIVITGEWIGQNADKYCSLVVLDKDVYLRYASGIKEIANEMLNFATDGESTIRKNQDDCENRTEWGY